MLACAACRISRFVLRLFGRGGTALPGKIALRLYPGLLARLARPVDVIMVTGTNGKTTTAAMLRHMLEQAGRPCLSNRAGANLLSGITAEFVFSASLTGRPRKKLAVIECDEGAFPAAAQAIRPKAVVVTTLFRDQLDRYGEVTHARRSILSGLEKAPEAVACLNADCSLTATLHLDAGNPCLFYGLDIPGEGEAAAVSDAPHCLDCGARYAYRRHTYAHLGDWYCPECGRERPRPDYSVTSVAPAPEGGSLVTMAAPEGNLNFRVALPALYNVCNAAAALAGAGAMGWDLPAAARSLESFGAVFGRMESLRLGDTPVQIVLVKNPAGCDRALEYLASLPEKCFPVFCLNDNLADGTDVSWIWDAAYETLFARRSFPRIGVYGTRAQDMRLRLKYAGADDEKIQVFDTADELVAAVRGLSVPVYILPNYTSMLVVRDKLAAASGGGKFWE